MRLLMPLFCAVSMAFAGDDSVVSKVDSLARAYADWGPSTSKPGTSLTFQEISRSGRKRVYHLVVTGLPLDGRFALIQWPVTAKAPSVLANPVFIDASGILMCKKNGDPALRADTANLIVDDIPGEPARFGVVNLADRSMRTLAKIVPRPIASEDGACRLTATYLAARGEVVFVEASGLRPEEAFHMTLHSGSQEVKEEGKASASGTYATSFLPTDKSVPSQKGHAQVHMEAASCSPSLSFAWGDISGE